MPQQTIEITVDVPEGYELTGEYRVPGKYESYLSLGGDVLIAHCSHVGTAAYLILRKLPDPDPEPPTIECSYLADGWVAADKDGNVFWFRIRPTFNASAWSAWDTGMVRHVAINHLPVATTLHDVPASESLRRVIHKEQA